MLHIYYEQELEEHWSIGKPWMHVGVNTRHVTEIEADGEELKLILARVKGIPTMKAQSLRWFGDYAKFIAGNFIKEELDSLGALKG